jgi:hypothetical protein
MSYQFFKELEIFPSVDDMIKLIIESFDNFSKRDVFDRLANNEEKLNAGVVFTVPTVDLQKTLDSLNESLKFTPIDIETIDTVTICVKMQHGIDFRVYKDVT